MHLASARVRSTNKARAQNAIEVYEPYPRGPQNLAAHALEARLDVVVDVALLGPLPQAEDQEPTDLVVIRVSRPEPLRVQLGRTPS